jgi:hypothetical protein
MWLKVITVVTVILLLVAMSVPVYAETTIPPLPVHDWEYWAVITDDLDNLYYVISHNPMTVLEDSNLKLKCITFRWYRFYNNQWSIIQEKTEEININFSTVHAANHDIAYDDESGFFFLSPKVPQLYQTMETTDFGTILRNFSAGLIPIVGLIVLATALTKGWRFLRGQLMT